MSVTTMARRRTTERTVFLPWERRTGLFRGVGLTRAKPLFAALLVVMAFGAVGLRERNRAAVRSTRATLLLARRAIDAFRAETGGGCPSADMNDLVAKGYLANQPRDAWGTPLRLVCPSRRAEHAYDLSSDGPDGVPGGLDRVE
ncbi:MAG: type II secretion system protein GspG [Polyangiaceae bacterium]